MQKVWEDVQGNAPDPYERWFDVDLERLRDRHSASDELSRRSVEQGMHLLDMQNAPPDVLEVLRDQHQNSFAQAWAAEALSRQAEQRFQDVVPKSRKVEAEEAAGLIRDAIQAELDAAEANAVEEFGSVIDRAIKSRRIRDLVARFKRETARSFCEDFCQRAEQDLPGYLVAYETLKLYVLGEITLAEMEVRFEAHLSLYPVTYAVKMARWRGQDTCALDDGRAMTGWHALAFLLNEHASLRRFRVCLQCGGLFYDASHARNKKLCGQTCIRQWKTQAKRRARGKTL